jgi:uncharacterized membrane protein
VKHLRRTVSLIIVVAYAAGTMALGTVMKSPCASGDWGDQRQYKRLCYSDIVPLLFTEQLDGSRLPFLNKCAPHPDSNCDEYPVLTMYFMRVSAWISGPSSAAFYFVNAALLLVCAAAIAACLSIMAGGRALMFALAPTLLIYGTMNWDLLAVALATAAMLAFFRRRDTSAGALLGLGAVAKAYPLLFAVPLAVHRRRQREPDRAIDLFWTSVFVWIGANLPFALIATAGWWEFFRFNAARVPDFDSLWYLACSRFTLCPSTHAVNEMSLVAFVVLLAGVWALKAKLRPGFPVWTVGYPMIVLFLLTNKVYSPQYGIWLLPWFVLALPNIWAWAAFEIADAMVFVTRFHWFATYPLQGVPWARFELALWARAVILMGTLALWVVHDAKPLAIETVGSPAPDLEPNLGPGAGLAPEISA